ncbi:hypothetical protein [Caballeronia sp. ATUFL_M2_KS44]|uniref:hypothetical protein n=1 Tax=Caballeronia sp. ATUFL_M2_KS44 TaxID=2921767 RepID=UPI0020285015|nr:hypothetical protein [Caballeronia sp. ATUFL_M2_KS44]
MRETWRGVVEINPPGKSVELGVARYVPDQEYCRRVEYQATHAKDSEPWRPSIHMPRWASRVTLEVTGVRVERLQDISPEDCIAEGIEFSRASFMPHGFRLYGEPGNTFCTDPIASYRSLCESINGDGAWDSNAWVWVVEFKVIKATGEKA